MIDIAKDMLYKDNLKILIYKDKKVVFKSKNRGIQPIFELPRKIKLSEVEGAYVADRVIGRAAAMILSSLKIKAIYTRIISEEAIKIFKENNIQVSYDKKVKNILNRTKEDLCPIEKLSQGVNNVEELLEEIEIFLKEVVGVVYE